MKSMWPCYLYHRILYAWKCTAGLFYTSTGIQKFSKIGQRPTSWISDAEELRDRLVGLTPFRYKAIIPSNNCMYPPVTSKAPQNDIQYRLFRYWDGFSHAMRRQNTCHLADISKCIFLNKNVHIFASNFNEVRSYGSNWHYVDRHWFR